MRKDDIIKEAVKIVKSNSKFYKLAYENYKGKYDVVTDQKTFSIDNPDNYSLDELKEIFEKKGYTVTSILPVDFEIPGYPYLSLESIPDATAPAPTPAPSTSTGTSPASPTVDEVISDDDKTFYYKVVTNYGIILLKNESDEAYTISQLKRVLRLNLRDVVVDSVDTSRGRPHDGYADSRYQIFEDFIRNPRILEEKIFSKDEEIKKITNAPATMDAPQDPIRAAFNMKELEHLPEEDKRKILGHKTDYWSAHRFFTKMLRDLRITSSTTVASLPPSSRDKGAVLIGILDDVMDGNLSQTEFIKRVEKLDEGKDSVDEFNASMTNLGTAFKDLFKKKKKE